MNRDEPAGRPASPDLDARLQLAIGWTFRDPALLDLALTHRSFCAERGIEASNERLEFLGDSVLGFVVTDLRVRRVSRSSPKASWPSCAPSS